jgi:histidinol phosphatase-like enzyme
MFAKISGKIPLFIITNQSGIANGIVTLEQVNTVNSFIVSELKNAGIKISAVYSCPHYRDDNWSTLKKHIS